MKIQKFYVSILCLFFSLFVSNMCAQQSAPGNALIAHYSFDGHTKDSSLNLLHGQFFGSNQKFTQGPAKQAIEFDGIAEYVSVNHHECFNSIEDQMTISGWVKPLSIANSGDWLAFICKGNSSGLNSSPYSVLYHYQELYPFFRYVGASGMRETYEFPVAQGVELNQWTFFTWTFKNKTVKVYKNGSLIGTTTVNFSVFNKNYQAFEMGRDVPGATEYLDGFLDDVCLFNKALSDNQILEMYEQKTCFSPVPEYENVVICAGENYLGHTNSGVFQDTLSDNFSCKYIKSTNLIVLPNFSSFEEKTICEGENYKGHTSSGIYLDTLQATNGCDSIHSLILNVQNLVNSIETIIICPNETVFIDGQIISQPGEYSELINNINGCDTLKTYFVHLRNQVTETRDIVLCPSDTFYLGSNLITEAGIYVDTLNSLQSCDTLISYVIQTYNFEEIDSIFDWCSSLQLVINGNSINESGIYYDTLYAQEFCDTIVRFQVTMVDFFEKKLSKTICEGDNVYINQQFYNQEGIYQDTIQNPIGCDTILLIEILELETMVSNEVIWKCPSDSIFWNNNWIHTEGHYQDSFVSIYSCDSIENLTVFNYEKKSSIFPKEVTICPGNPISLSSPYAGTVWNNTNTNIEFILSELEPVLVSFLDENNCPNQDTILTKPCCTKDKIYVANAFAPDQYNGNDLFRIYTEAPCDNFIWAIYDRWGALVFEGSGQNSFWDGKVNGEIAEAGVYVWIIELFPNSETSKQVLTGDVTLIR